MYTMDARIRYSELDATGRLSTLGLLNFLQDAAIFHCEDVGRSVASLAQDGKAWYVLTWGITINKLPGLGERVRIRTWVPGMRGLITTREFAIEDDAGSELVRATSSWVFFDVAQGRAVRIPDEEAAFFADDFNGVSPRRNRRSFKPTGEGIEATPLVVGLQHIDTNRHVNNAQYIRMAREAVADVVTSGNLPTELVDKTRTLPLRLEVEYRNMARLGDVLTPRIYQEEGGIIVSLDGKDNVSAVVRFA